MPAKENQGGADSTAEPRPRSPPMLSPASPVVRAATSRIAAERDGTNASLRSTSSPTPPPTTASATTAPATTTECFIQSIRPSTPGRPASAPVAPASRRRPGWHRPHPRRPRVHRPRPGGLHRRRPRQRMGGWGSGDNLMVDCVDCSGYFRVQKSLFT